MYTAFETMSHQLPSDLTVFLTFDKFGKHAEILDMLTAQGVTIVHSLDQKPDAVFSDRLTYLNEAHGLGETPFFYLSDGAQDVPQFVDHIRATVLADDLNRVLSGLTAN